MLPNIIAICAIALIVGAAAFYIVRAKRRGQKCIGCPDSPRCSGSCSSCCGCHMSEADEK